MTGNTRRRRWIAGMAAAALLTATITGVTAPAEAQSTQQRLQNQQENSRQNLQGSTNQLNQSLRNTQNQINNRANMQGLEQRQTIQNMQQNQMQPTYQRDLNNR